MIAKFFSKTKPINTLIVLTFLAIIFLLSLFSNSSLEISLTSILKRFILLSLFLVCLFVINFITRKNKLTKNNSYVLLLIVLFVGMFPVSLYTAKLLFSNFLLLFGFRRIYSLRSQKKIKEKLFDSSFWIGIATIIYPWSFIYIFLVQAAVVVFKKLTPRHLIIPIVGFLVPLFLYMVYLMVVDDFRGFNLPLSYSLEFFSYNSLKLLIPITLIITMLIWAVLPTSIKIMSINNELRQSWMLVLFHLMLSIIIIVLSPNKNGAEFLFLIFPMAIIFTNYLQRVQEKWFKEVFLYLFLAVTISIYFL